MKDKDIGIAIYSRKSKYTGKGESIGNQIELCKEYIRTHYGEDHLARCIVYEDEGFSGGNLNRPAFKRMMKAAKACTLDTIIVYRLDRISRNISDFSALIQELEQLNIAFVSIREQFDTSTPMGRAMMYITSVFSQLERETIAERIRDNMHELAKTGRWLGGTTPTGYASESTQWVTVDGKAKKACKLKLIPEEAEVVKTIFQLFMETDSLALTEAELMRRRIVTKNNKDYTRFSIKNILQNPVYMMADQAAYAYFFEQEAELFSDPADFDGIHGIMTYNRTDQTKGKSTLYLPIREWIISVGQHPGLIPGKTWVSVQASLERNKSKSYRKPRSNEALLTGVLYCRCGSRMYPKLSKRKTATGTPVYTYVCKLKERSQGSRCAGKNANGNMLDTAVIEQIKLLESDSNALTGQLEQSRKLYTGNSTQYEAQQEVLRQEHGAQQKKIDALVDSLADLRSSPAKDQILRRIEQLNAAQQSIQSRIQELEGLAARQTLSNEEFDTLRQLLSSFSSGMETLSVEQLRAAIRTVVRKVIWDGTNAHMLLFGAPEDEIEYPDLSGLYAQNKKSTSVNPAEDSHDPHHRVPGERGRGAPGERAKPHWGEDCK